MGKRNCRLDEIFSPADLIHVVDADASQTLVIETVKREADLVVQGPPGTGKSQTITNMIAGAVNDGKRVLFLSEKMAALDVVYKRLQDVGLLPWFEYIASQLAAIERTLGTIAPILQIKPNWNLGELSELIALLRGISDAPADSPFEESVEQVIRGLGFEVDRQVGSAGFRIDLAVRDPELPGSYLLAVECDGATCRPFDLPQSPSSSPC
jgi:hypothetical protein